MAAEGCDLSRTVCESVTKRTGIPVFHGDIAQAPKRKTFDVVVINHVLARTRMLPVQVPPRRSTSPEPGRPASCGRPKHFVLRSVSSGVARLRTLSLYVFFSQDSWKGCRGGGPFSSPRGNPRVLLGMVPDRTALINWLPH